MLPDMASAPGNHLECPVCHKGFTEPKLLPCTHLVCRKCMVSWLEKGGDQNGCPLCRAPILPDSAKSPGDFASQVDALPTDLATVAEIESMKLLTGNQVCSCKGKASLFCLQCALKLCDICAQTHAKIPATQDHVTENLCYLTAERLALHHFVPCTSHQAKQAELYCSNHEQVICVLCAFSAHRKCEVEAIGELAQTKREELRVEVKKLEEREAAITEKVNKLELNVFKARTKLMATGDEVKATFDDLRRSLDAQEERLIKCFIQGELDTIDLVRNTRKQNLEKLKLSVSAHKSTAEHVVRAAPDGALLGMMGKLDALRSSQLLPDDPDVDEERPFLKLNPVTVKKMKAAFAAIATETEPGRSLKTERQQFPAGRVHRQLKKRMRKKVEPCASIYTAAVLEYLAAEVLELAGNACRKLDSEVINPRHIQLAIEEDDELNSLVKATIAEGGLSTLYRKKEQDNKMSGLLPVRRLLPVRKIESRE